VFKSNVESCEVLDFFATASPLLAVADLDDIDTDTRDLVVRLLTRAGMVMEDASAEAILSAADAPLESIIQRLECSAAAINSLVSAAAALVSPAGAVNALGGTADYD
jgi:hypothetical protein